MPLRCRREERMDPLGLPPLPVPASLPSYSPALRPQPRSSQSPAGTDPAPPFAFAFAFAFACRDLVLATQKK